MLTSVPASLSLSRAPGLLPNEPLCGITLRTFAKLIKALPSRKLMCVPDAVKLLNMSESFLVFLPLSAMSESSQPG